jgi:hypothetical protein
MLWRVRRLDYESLVKSAIKPKVTITAKDVNGSLITAIDKANSQDDIGTYYPGLQGPQSRARKRSKLGW